jgi:hypothetical protein
VGGNQQCREGGTDTSNLVKQGLVTVGSGDGTTTISMARGDARRRVRPPANLDPKNQEVYGGSTAMLDTPLVVQGEQLGEGSARPRLLRRPRHLARNGSFCDVDGTMSDVRVLWLIFTNNFNPIRCFWVKSSFPLSPKANRTKPLVLLKTLVITPNIFRL